MAKNYRVIVLARAEDDLAQLHDYIATREGGPRADGYLDRILAYLASFSVFPMRGARRDDVRAGLRTVGFERRITVVFAVLADEVEVLRVLYGGQDLEAVLGDNP